MIRPHWRMFDSPPGGHVAHQVVHVRQDGVRVRLLRRNSFQGGVWQALRNDEDVHPAEFTSLGRAMDWCDEHWPLVPPTAP